jgi:hypothetical protein
MNVTHRLSLLLNKFLMSLVQFDNFSHFGYAIRNRTALETMNATTWVKRQFTANYLLDPMPYSPENLFDGLDVILLLSWLHRKFSESDNQPFVLHYYDLRSPNIILDQDNNLAG